MADPEFTPAFYSTIKNGYCPICTKALSYASCWTSFRCGYCGNLLGVR